MILRALNDYYERLAADPHSGVAEYGFSRQHISFVIVLDEDGTLHEVQDARREDEQGKLRPRSLVVLGNSKPSGSGINPCFLWDNAAYALGYKPDDPKPERTQESFDRFREQHLTVRNEIDDDGFNAVCRFLESWNPKDAEGQPVLKELGTGFGVFRYRTEKAYMHERPAINRWWRAQIKERTSDTDLEMGQCLVTGEVGPIARIHEPKIKGVYGAQSSGALLVSFNFKALDSYGKEQGNNAPLSKLAAFRYCVALNRLLDRASGRRLSVGDTSVVYWTDRPSPAESWIAELFNPSTSAEDEATVNRVHSVLDSIAQGRFPQDLGQPETRFFVLGLSPNASRISVRFWYERTLGDFLENLGRHFADLEIIRGSKDLPHPPLWRLLRETVRDPKDIPDLLEGSLLRAIITGQPYPQMFFSSLLRRIQADREVRFIRAAAIKACLNRNYQQEVSMSLDPNRPDVAYQLGRLFAELEKCQERALPGINDTIRDRYFGAASATPRSVFPRLIRMNQHHLGKLEKGAKTYHDKRIQQIAVHVDDFPAHLSMRDQGLFAIGYYHQRQDIFTKKAANEEGVAATSE